MTAVARAGAGAPAARVLVRTLAGARRRVQLADGGAAGRLPGGAGRLSVLLRHLDQPAEPAGGARPGVFIGLDNFIADWHDPVFRQVVLNTFVYTVAATLLKMVGGLGLALVMNQDFRFKNLTRALLLLPFIVPTVLSTIAWQWILDPAFSVVNWVLMHTGIADPGPSWLGNPVPRDVLADHGQHLARAAVLRHHPAGRPADHLARALRGRDHRRRRPLAAASATSPCRCSSRSSSSSPCSR